MWRILTKRELEIRKLAAKKRNLVADERYLRANGGRSREAAYRHRFYKAYAWHAARARMKARRAGG